MAAKEIYCFVSPFPVQETVEKISEALAEVGKIKTKDSARGYIKGKYKVSAVRYIDIEFYIERGEESCQVRALFYGAVIVSAKDKWWNCFLSALFNTSPGADFGVLLTEGKPYVMGVLYLGSDTKLVHQSVTTGGTSMTGFLLGDLLFGTAGAIVGGLSGNTHTCGSTETQFSNTQLARLIYSNGRIWESQIVKDSPLYNEIMVNMRTLQR